MIFAVQLWKMLYTAMASATKVNVKLKAENVDICYPPNFQNGGEFDLKHDVESHSQGHVFSYQDYVNGQRRFLATTYEEFWRWYKSTDPKFFHHYEVILEGLLCHLYFDLEYSCSANAKADGVAMVDLLLSVISDALLD